MTSGRVGDDRAGFTVQIMPHAIVEVKAWGFWDRETAAAFGPRVIDACRTHPKGALRMDLRDMKPMRDEGQASFALLLRSLGQTSLSLTVGSHLVKLQLLRIAEEAKAMPRVEFIDAV